MPRHPTPSVAIVLAEALAATASQSFAAPASCEAKSGQERLTVVELYTSEGCSSCPPADRWLSGLKGRDDVLAQAFHVDYWDRLGWKDLFASPAYTERQDQWRALGRARFIYTPQTIVDGADRRDLPARHEPAGAALALRRDGEGYRATVTSTAASPARLAAYWSVTESGHRSVVKAGENEGATLHHDFVVRELRPVAPWSAAPGVPQPLQFSPGAAADAAHPRDVNLVVFDPATGRPLQALRLGC
jgi:hypothetical protein